VTIAPDRAIEVTPVVDEPGVGDDEVHYVCCEWQPGEPAMCGCPDNGDPLLEEDVPLTCTMCYHLYEERYCPRYGRCKVPL
jgi:hypothetical protein